MVSEQPLKVCYFGTYRKNYSRNQMMIAGLRENNILVTECHEVLWHGIEDRVQAVSGGWVKPRFWGRILITYWRLLKRYRQVGDYDILIVGYPGHLDVYLARILTWIKHKPMTWDVFMSIYLVAVERGLEIASKFSIKLLHLIEWGALRFPEMLILDTTEYVKWFSDNYKISPDKFRLIPTGADDRIFTPKGQHRNTRKEFLVLYAGTFIPNHGVKYIVEAARVLHNHSWIIFELIGEGPDLEYARQYVDQHKLENVRFYGWMEKDTLIRFVNDADVCLGAFGTTPQSMMTVQNKIYETMAMCKPLISGDSPAVRQVFNHGEQIYLCERANGQSIADAIMTLWRDPSLRERIAQNAYDLFKEHYTVKSNGMLFEAYLRELVK